MMMKLYKSLFTITALAVSVAPALIPSSAMAQTVLGRGVNAGSDAISVAAPQVRDLGLTVTRITDITTQIEACAATGQLSEEDGSCTNGLLPVDIRFEDTGTQKRLYIQDTNGNYMGDSGPSNARYYNLDGENGAVNVVPFGG